LHTPYPFMIYKWYIPPDISDLTLTRISISDY
ncbi:GntR family transcriptional regulator, partial [Staphylococcus aureus]|nr:GntR family transcriptional regulator [Staphylococcus aureus]